MSDSCEQIEFALDKGLSLPQDLTVHRIGDQCLFIAPAKGLYLTVTETGADLVRSLRDGKTLAHAMREAMDRRHLSETQVMFETRALLRQVVIKQFYEETDPPESTAEPSELNLQLHLTQQCNLRCKYCYMDSGIAPSGELSLAEWQAIVDEFLDLGGQSVTYSGGEPLMFPGFYELAEYVKQRHLDAFLITNGMLIQDKTTAERLAKLVSTIRVSVDGASEEVHERIRGKGTFAKVNRAIELLAETGVRLELAITIYPDNLEDVARNLSNYLTHLQDRGVKRSKVGISQGMQSGRCHEILDRLAFESEFRKIQCQIYGDYWDLRIFKPIKTVQCAYGSGLTVFSTGAASPCGMVDGREINLRTHSLAEVRSCFRDQRLRTLVYAMLLCRDCDLRFICGGGCRIENLRHTGDFCTPRCSPERRQREYESLAGRDEVFYRVARRLDDEQAPERPEAETQAV